MARAAKEATVIVLDTGRNVTQIDPNNITKETFFERSCDCMTKLLERKIFNKPKDEVGLLLMGTEETNNMLAGNLGGYEHISEFFCLAMTSWHMLRVINKEIKPSETEADWIDAIIVAIDYLKEQTEAKKFTSKRIILFTNFATNVDASHVDTVISALKSLYIDLIVIGANVIPNHYDSKTSVLEKKYFSQKGHKSAQQQIGERLITKIIDETEGTICSFDDAVTELTFYANRKITPSPWYSSLTIGPSISISITAFKKISDDACLQPWKNRVTLPESSCVLKREYFKQSEEGTAVDMEDLIQGYKYGSTCVPFTSADESVNYDSGARCLSILGFTNQSNINREWFLGKGVLYVVARSGYESSERSFAALVEALDKFKMAGIARRVYNNGNAPQINCLLPKITSKYKCLVMIQMPFFEDMHLLAFPPLIGKKITPTQSQLDAVDNLIDSMDLMTAALNEDDEPIEAYNMKRTLDPHVQHTYHSLAYRAMYKNEELLPPKPEVLALINVPPVVEKKAREPLQKIKELFPLTEKEAVISSKQKWVNNQLSKVGAKEDLDMSRPDLAPGAPDGHQDVAGLTSATLVEVGSVNPTKDFEQLLIQGEIFSKVVPQMQKVISNLVMRSFDRTHTKPLEALETLRKHCITSGPGLYNDWIREFKGTVITLNHREFWDKIIEGKLGLITNQESAASSVVESEAEAFLHAGTTAGDNTGQGDELIEDADDLFDEM